MKNTILLIKEKKGKGNVVKFVEDEFKMNYRTFVHQIQKGTMRYRDIVRLIDLLGIKFEDLKDYEYSEKFDPEKEKIKKQIAKLHEIKPKKLSELIGNK
jgi:hypothetical protein